MRFNFKSFSVALDYYDWYDQLGEEFPHDHVFSSRRKPDDFVEATKQAIQKDSSFFQKKDGATAILLSASSGQVRLTKLLLDMGANVNIRETTESNPGYTPLHYACRDITICKK